MQAILLVIALLAAGHTGTNAVCTKKMDLAFTVDGSSTVCGAESCPNWISILQFIHNIVDSLIIGPDGTQVAFYKVSNQFGVEWNFNRYQEKSLLLSAIDGVVYPGGELTVASALKLAVKDFFTPEAGDRPDVPNVGIIIMDGAPNIDPNLAFAKATLFHGNGLRVFAVCVTSRCTEKFAHMIASPPKKINETYFLVKDYSSLGLFTEKLVNEICASEDKNQKRPK